MRQNVGSGSPWEAQVGDSRAVRVRNVVHVAGATATIGGVVVGVNDPDEQTRVALGLVRAALREAGANMEDVVRTRLFVKDIARWEDIGRAHGEVFGQIRPAATMVQVAALIHPEHLVPEHPMEVEAEAVLP